MILAGEIVEDDEGWFGARLALPGLVASGMTRKQTCQGIANAFLREASRYVDVKGLEIQVRDDGESTIYVSSNDPARFVAVILRQRRDSQSLSLADVAAATGAKSRNGWAQYEKGKIVPSMGKLEQLLSTIAPDFALAIIPRSAQVLPRWTGEANLDKEVAALVDDPSEENLEALLRSPRLVSAPEPRAVARAVGRVKSMRAKKAVRSKSNRIVEKAGARHSKSSRALKSA
ncbi:MAG: helix-turn-helix transcriptional regulator [Kofleriaceae bacterium]